MNALPQQYITGLIAANKLCRRYPQLDRQDVRQEASLEVAKKMGRGKINLRGEYIFNRLRFLFVIQPAIQRDAEFRLHYGLRPKVHGGAPPCAKPEHKRRDGHKCVDCRLERGARYRARRRQQV